MKSYFMDEVHSIRTEIVNCKNKTKLNRGASNHDLTD